MGHTGATFEPSAHTNGQHSAFVADARTGCRKCFSRNVDDTCKVQAVEKVETEGVLPLRRPHVGALHVVLVGSGPDHIASDLIQIEERLRVGSIVCGNFGGAPLTAIQTRKKLAALTAIISAPEGTDAGASTAHILTGKQLEVGGATSV